MYDIISIVMCMNNKIGVFDSGIGGMSTLNEIRKLLPNENFIYYADSKNNPYGEKTDEELKAFEETMSSIIRDLVFEASDIACWVFAKKYVNGWTLEQMIEDMPHAFKFIVAMNTLFEQHMEPTSEEKFKN